MLIVNFSHPLTPDQLAAVEQLTGQPVDRVLDVKTQFDHDRPFTDQARELVEAAGLSPEQWQGEPLLVNLPSLSPIAAVVLAELHGRCGYFPSILRLKPVAGSTPPRFEVAETVNLQAVRDTSREAR